MATPAAFKTGIGTIQITMGTVRIVDSTGYVRNALEGDRVDLHDTLIAGGDAYVQVRLDNGRLIDVTHDSMLVLEPSVVGPESAAAPAATPADVAALQAVIAAGADPSQIAQAAAAGAPGAGGAEGGGGHTFVVLEQANTAGEVTAGFSTAPAAIVYPSIEPASSPVVEGVTLPEAPPVISVTARVAEGVELPPAGGTTPGIDVKAATVLEGTGPHEGTEGHVVYFALHLDRPSASDVEVTYVIRPGTAQFPADFTEGDTALTHTVVIPAGMTELAVPVTITGDHLVEPNETFDIVLIGAINGTIDAEGNRATVTIVDDDAAPIALPDTNWAQEDLVNATGNVLQDLAHGGAPRGVFADVADIDFETLAVASVNGAGANVGQAVAGAYGTLTLAANGAYTYVPDAASNAVQSLDDGETLTEAFSYTVTDGYNAPASATLTITVFGTNDAPAAHSDTNWVLEDGEAAVGNVLHNLAHPGAPAGLHADVADTDLDEEALSVSTAGSFSGRYGTLVLNEDGSYRYTLDRDDPEVQALAAGERLTDRFSYTATDGTDSAPALLTISIFGSNDAPVIGSSSARVSEEGLAAGIPDTTGSIDTTNAATASGAIAVADLDQDALAITLSAPETALYSNGAPLQWTGEGSSTLIGSAAGRTIVTIAIDDTGAYAVTLSGSLDHADETAEDEALFTVGVHASDGTATVRGTLHIAVEDDAPRVTLTGLEPALAVDESVLSDDASADFSGAFATAFGADGPGSVHYGLNIVGGNGVDSGLDDSVTGQRIVLVLNGNAVEGRVGSVNGALAFTITLDEARGRVGLDQLRAVMHASADSPDTSEPAAIAAGLVNLVATAIDADGDRHAAALDIGRRISFLDDGPSVIVPVSAHVVNAAAATFSGALDFDFNVDDNAGADQRASVTFDAAQHGKDSGLTSGGSPIHLYVSDSGKTLTGSTAASEAGVTPENTVFTVVINQDAAAGVANDYYTITMMGVVDNGAGVVFSDLSGTGPAGNPPWKVVESAEPGRDILFTPVAPAMSVNSDSDDVGVDSQFIDYGKGLRIDFADLAVTGKAQSIDYGFGPGGHYNVNHFSFGINEIANGTVADITLRAYNADEDDPITATLTDDAQSRITQVRVYDSADRLVAAASDDAAQGGIEFDFDAYPAGGVTVRGLQEGYSIVTVSDEGYNRLEIVNAGTGGEDGKFSLNQLEVLSIDTGSPVDTSFQIALTDADGDSASALINVTFEPAGGEEMPLSGSDAALYGAEAASREAVDLHATLQSLVPHATSAADYDGYVTLDSQSAPGHTIVMVDPTGNGDYQPLVTLTDVANLTLQELLEQHQVLVA